METETGGITGAADKDYNIIWISKSMLASRLAR